MKREQIRDTVHIILITIAFFCVIISIFIAEQIKAAERFAVWREVDIVSNDTMLSDEAFQACNEIGKEYGISPELIMAIAEVESSGNPNAKNGGCEGLMQVASRWHKDRMKRLDVEDIYDERGNILIATDYLLELFEEYEDVTRILDEYNGNSAAAEYEERGIISEYAEAVLSRAADLERAHGK